MPILFLRAALLCLSFTGLCAASCAVLNLNRFIAHCFAACTVISVMTLCGMLHILKWGFFLLYFGGFAGLAYAYLFRRIRPEFPLIGLFALLAALLSLRLAGGRLFIADDFSQWALVLRHMLETDRFPDASARLVTFQSYPLGAASFLYYVCRTLGSREDLWMIAQNMLHALLLLPLFAHAEQNKKQLAPLLPVIFLLLFKSARPLSTLCVDWLLGLCGVGMAGIVLYYRNDPKKAFIAVLPCLTASVLLKSSGIFFSVCTAALLALAAPRKYRIKLLPGALAVSIGMFLLWSLHVAVTFPAGFETKHAVSMTAYAQNASEKSPWVMLVIAAKIALAWLPPDHYRLFALLFAACCSALVLTVRRRQPELRQTCREALRGLFFCIAVYALWIVMLYLMYIFSMPEYEARNIAAFSRYDSTCLLYVTGLAIIIMLRFVNRLALSPGRTLRIACAAAAIALVFAPMISLNMAVPGLKGFYRDLIDRETFLPDHRTALDRISASNDLSDENGRYIIYCGAVPSASEIHAAFYCSKYDLNTPDVITVMRRTAKAHAQQPYILRGIQGKLDTDDPIEALAVEIAQCDAVLILDRDPVFERLLSEYLSGISAKIPIFYA